MSRYAARGPTDLLERRRGAGAALRPMPPLRTVSLGDKGGVARRLILADTGAGNAGEWRVVPGANAAVAKLGAQAKDMLALATRTVALLEARGVRYGVHHGTMLGVLRGGDLIPGDCPSYALPPPSFTCDR